MLRPFGKPTPLDRLVLLVIMLVAIGLRAEYLLQIEHTLDHAWPVMQALETLDRGIWPLVGQGTSVLFASGPVTGYLYLPFIALTRSPLGAYLLVIALNTLGVLLTYRASRVLVGPRWALIAAGLMAVNPWVIEYSRTSWVQSLLPFFVPAVAWLLWPVLLGQSRRPVRRLALALTMLALLCLSYLLAFVLVIPVGLLLFIFRARVPRRGLAIGGTVFVVLSALYGLGLLGQWETVQARLGEFSSGPAMVSAEAWDHAVRLVSGGDYELVRGQQAPAGDSAPRHDLSRLAHLVILAAMLGGIGLAAWAVVGRHGDDNPAVGLGGVLRRFAPVDAHTRQAAIIALAWFLLPVLLMTYVSQMVHPFYQLLGLPAGFVLAAWGLGMVLRPQTRPGAILLAALAVPLAVLMGLNSARYYQETAALPGAHGLTALSLEYGLPLGAAIRDAMPENPVDGVAFVDLEGWLLNSLAGRWFPTMREARAAEFNIIPQGGGVYVAAHDPALAIPAGEPRRVAPLGSTEAARFSLPDGWLITVDAFAPDAAVLCTVDNPEPLREGEGYQARVNVPGEQGIALRAYDLRVDETARWTLTTLWRVEARSDVINQRLFGAFAHLFDADSTRVAIIDGADVPGHEWRVGDCHVHRMTFFLPEDGPPPFTLRVGQFDAINHENVIFRLPPDSVDGDYSPLFTLEPSIRPPDGGGQAG